MSAKSIIGIDVSRDWLDEFCLPGKQRFRFQNSPDGHARLLEILQSMPDGLKVGFEKPEADRNGRSGVFS